MIFLTAISFSCSNDDNPVSTVDIFGSGNIITETRTVPQFNKIIFESAGEVRVSTGSEQSVTVSVDDNIMEYINTSVTNGTLRISDRPNVDLEDFELVVDLTMTDIEGLAITGVGNIISDEVIAVDNITLANFGVSSIIMDLDVNRVFSQIGGVGSVVLTGSARRHDISHSGVGLIDAYGMANDTTFAHLSSIGDARVSVNDRLSVTIAGSGSLYYRGYPDIDSVITGTGSIVDDN
jgi:hypothetical protein